MEPWIDYDVEAVQKLKAEYEENLEIIVEMLPADVNWNSTEQIKKYFREFLDIELENVKINHVSKLLERYDDDSQEFDVINGLVLYLRLKFTITNYLNCILRHQNQGRVNLRLMAGQWVMPNRQPVSASPEIVACETGRNGV